MVASDTHFDIYTWADFLNDSVRSLRVQLGGLSYRCYVRAGPGMLCWSLVGHWLEVWPGFLHLKHRPCSTEYARSASESLFSLGTEGSTGAGTGRVGTCGGGTGGAVPKANMCWAMVDGSLGTNMLLYRGLLCFLGQGRGLLLIWECGNFERSIVGLGEAGSLSRVLNALL